MSGCIELKFEARLLPPQPEVALFTQVRCDTCYHYSHPPSLSLPRANVEKGALCLNVLKNWSTQFWIITAYFIQIFTTQNLSQWKSLIMSQIMWRIHQDLHICHDATTDDDDGRENVDCWWMVIFVEHGRQYFFMRLWYNHLNYNETLKHTRMQCQWWSGFEGRGGPG